MDTIRNAQDLISQFHHDHPLASCLEGDDLWGGADVRAQPPSLYCFPFILWLISAFWLFCRLPKRFWTFCLLLVYTLEYQATFGLPGSLLLHLQFDGHCFSPDCIVLGRHMYKPLPPMVIFSLVS
jgi:hypothetical protein